MTPDRDSNNSSHIQDGDRSGLDEDSGRTRNPARFADYPSSFDMDEDGPIDWATDVPVPFGVGSER